jgi:hypothetical protein
MFMWKEQRSNFEKKNVTCLFHILSVKITILNDSFTSIEETMKILFVERKG